MKVGRFEFQYSTESLPVWRDALLKSKWAIQTPAIEALVREVEGLRAEVATLKKPVNRGVRGSDD